MTFDVGLGTLHNSIGVHIWVYSWNDSPIVEMIHQECSFFHNKKLTAEKILSNTSFFNKFSLLVTSVEKIIQYFVG